MGALVDLFSRTRLIHPFFFTGSAAVKGVADEFYAPPLYQMEAPWKVLAIALSTTGNFIAKGPNPQTKFAPFVFVGPVLATAAKLGVMQFPHQG